MKKMIVKCITVLLLGAFLYLILGAFLPPLFLPDAPAPGPLQHPGRDGERIVCIDDNRESLFRRLQMIRSARHSVLLSTYSFQDDESGQDIMAALYDAARRDVQVKILLDGLSAGHILASSQRFQTLTAHPNVHLAVYNPVNPLTPWAINYRMHDKLLICDDEFYILGGRNTRNVSLGAYQDEYDIDRDVLVYSPLHQGSIRQVQDYFSLLWKEAAPRSGTFQKEAAELLTDRWQLLHQSIPSPWLHINWELETVPAAIRLLHNPVGVGPKVPVLWNSLMQLMDGRQDVLIQTPYLICNRMMYRDLTNLCRNTDAVQVLLNAPEVGANICGVADYQSQKDRILRTGVSLAEQLGSHSSHTKTILIDDSISLVGSFNFDIRSSYLNTETMLLIDCPQLNEHLRQQAEQILSCSRRYTEDGAAVLGPDCSVPAVSLGKQLGQSVTRVFVRFFRHLL